MKYGLFISYSIFTSGGQFKVNTFSSSCDGAELVVPNVSGTAPKHWSQNMFNNCKGTAANNIQLGGHYCIKEYIAPYTRYIASGNWATVCFPHKFLTSTTGVASLYKLTAINAADTKVALNAVAMADVVAGVPYIFQSNSTEAKQAFMYKPENKVDNPVVEGTNGLNGVFADSTLTEEKWVITNNAVTPAAIGSFVGQYRCFIDLGLLL